MPYELTVEGFAKLIKFFIAQLFEHVEDLFFVFLRNRYVIVINVLRFFHRRSRLITTHRIFDLFARPQLPRKTECKSSASSQRSSMRVGDITRCDVFVWNRIVLEVHHSLWKVRRPLTVRTAEVANDVAGAVRSFPDVTAVDVVS